MPNYKLIATDLDDTLLDDNLRISPNNKQELRRAAGLGATITVATGRMYQSALPYAQELGIRGPIITYQGALVKDITTGEVLMHRTVPLELTREVLFEGYVENLHMNIYIDDKLYMHSLTWDGSEYAKMAEVKVHVVGNLLEFVKHEPTKILFIGDPGKLNELQRKMQEKFGDSLYITKSKVNFLEFMHPLATKKSGLQILNERLGISREETMAFGDSYNDLEMLEYAGMGVAMGNAREAIRKIADYVTDTNNHDGVAKAVKKFILSDG